jgi:uncharacterized cupin superfamily protein
MVAELQLEPTEHGLVPTGKGWFVLKRARSAVDRPQRSRRLLRIRGFDSAADFSQLGINLTILAPGVPMAIYHREND